MGLPSNFGEPLRELARNCAILEGLEPPPPDQFLGQYFRPGTEHDVDWEQLLGQMSSSRTQERFLMPLLYFLFGL